MGIWEVWTAGPLRHCLNWASDLSSLWMRLQICAMQPFTPNISKRKRVRIKSFNVKLRFFPCNFSDSESPRQWHLPQASDLQSEEKGWRLIWVQGDRCQLRGATGTQGPGLPESQCQQPCAENAGLWSLAHVATRHEASKECVIRGSQQHPQLCQPTNALHLQPSSGSQNPQTKSTIRYGNPFWAFHFLTHKPSTKRAVE